MVSTLQSTGYRQFHLMQSKQSRRKHYAEVTTPRVNTTAPPPIHGRETRHKLRKYPFLDVYHLLLTGTTSPATPTLWQYGSFKEEKMKTHLRVFAIVVFILVIGCGTASAYNKTNMQSVVINMDGAPRMVSTDKETVGDLLEDLANTIDTDYILDGAKESDPIEAMMTLSLTSVTEKTVASTEAIPYKTVERTNNSLKAGEKKVVQEGKDGVASVISKEIYHGNELVETKFVEKKVTTEAQDKIVEVGPKNVVNGMKYSKAINAKVTAYTPYDAGCTGITATGTKAGYGTVAVDPRVIPLGSKVYIPGYGTAIAADTGGAIKGNRVDVCYSSKSEAFGWGVKNTTVYVLA